MKEDTLLFKINSVIIIASFCLLIFTPLIVAIIEKDEGVSQVEKRELALLPKTPKTKKDIKAYPKLFDKYYSDQFGFREWLIKYFKLMVYYLGDSPSEDITLGKEGWFFLGSIKTGAKDYDDPIGDVRNINLYTQKQLEVFAARTNYLNKELNKRGIKYLLVIAPNKHTIYFDKLPGYIDKVNKKSATDQLYEYLGKHTDTVMVDLREPLLKAKQKHQLYYKVDSHWNYQAANIAQDVIIKKIATLFPGKIQPEIIKMEDRMRGIGRGDLADNIGVRIFNDYEPWPLFEPTCKLIRNPPRGKGTQTHSFSCDTEQLNVVIFRDSFFNGLQPFFARKFKRSTYIWGRMQYDLLVEAVKREKPDIIIEEIVERNLPYLPELMKEK